MKKLLVVVLGLVVVASWCFAEEPAASERKGAIVGKIVDVVVVEPVKGVTAGTVNLVDESGNPISFTVTTSTKIADGALNVLTLNQLNKGDQIEVKPGEEKEGKVEAGEITVKK